MAAFLDDAGQNFVPHHVNIPAVDIEPLQTGVEIDAQPFPVEDHIRVGIIKLLQAVADRPRAVGQQLLPTGIERLKIDRAVNLLDQVVLAWEIAIQQRLGYAQATRQIPCTAAKALFRKEFGRFDDELLAPIVRREPLLLGAGAPARCLRSHDLSAADPLSATNRP